MEKDLDNCPFCHLSENVKVICDSDDCIAFYDRFPVSKGHVLIVPKRHVANYFDLTKSEIASMQQMLIRVKKILDSKFKPDGYNIGVNVNEAAGQSVLHVHMHLIPRYKGDVENPRGGVRGVIPQKQNY
jgi:diadenosine tetraphosphate (Ap4A) HIT family hydrolase